MNKIENDIFTTHTYTGDPIDDNMLWRNPCPDASVPMSSPGMFSTSTGLNYGTGGVKPPHVANETGGGSFTTVGGKYDNRIAANHSNHKPNTSVREYIEDVLTFAETMMNTPTLKPGEYKNPLDLAIDSIRKQFASNEAIVVEQAQKITSLQEQIYDLIVERDSYKQMYEDIASRLTRTREGLETFIDSIYGD